MDAADITTRYSLAPDALNEPEIEVLTALANEKAVGCAEGAAQAGKVVVALPVNGLAVKYFGPPLQEILFTEKTKK